MSFGAKPQVVDNDPYKNMPPELREYIIESVGRLGDSDIRGDELRQIYSDPSMLIADYAGQEGLEYTLGAAEAGMGAAGAGIDAARSSAGQAVDRVSGAAGTGRAALDDIISQLQSSGTRLGGISTDLGSAPDVSGSQSRMRQFADLGLGSVTGATQGLTGAADRLQGINTNLGQAFDTTGTRDALTGMDVEGRQRRYEQDYTNQMIDPVMSRMREEEALRAAQLEGANAAIGGSSNSRLAVAQARLADESIRSQAQIEAEMRQRALRESQDLGLRESELMGNLTEAAGRLGLSQSELDAAIARQSAELGISREQAIANIYNQAGGLGLAGAELGGNLEQSAANLGMDRAELEASIRDRAARLGISVEEAQRAILGDMSANVGSQFGMDRDVASQLQSQAGMEIAAGQLGLDAGRMGMAAGGTLLEQSAIERGIQQEQMQAPLTMESWYRNLVSGGPALAPPATSTQTTSGGGPGAGTQLLGAGATALGAYLGSAGTAAGGLGALGGALASSSEKVKTDVEKLDGALDIIRRQRPSVYRYIDPMFDRVPIEGRRSAGLMAGDLRGIPGAVIEINGIEAVDPYPVMATIAAAVQELDRKVEAMSHG